MGGSFSLCGCNGCNGIEDTMNGMIFYPPKMTESEINLILRKDDKHIFLESTDGALISVITAPPKGEVKKYIVWAHGNANNVSHFFDYVHDLRNNLGVGFIIFDYQGYGCSQGEPSEKHCYDDMEAVMNYALEVLKVDRKDIYLIGASLGTGIVVHYAHDHNWKTPIILISPYKTIIKVVFDTPILKSIDKFRTEAKIGKLLCPVQIFHGQDDELIKIKHAKKLFQQLGNKDLQPVWFENVDHDNIYWHIRISHFKTVLDYDNHYDHKN